VTVTTKGMTTYLRAPDSFPLWHLLDISRSRAVLRTARLHESALGSGLPLTFFLSVVVFHSVTVDDMIGLRGVTGAYEKNQCPLGFLSFHCCSKAGVGFNVLGGEIFASRSSFP
jgi:hypothetical protein